MERTDLEQWRSKEVARLLALVETERRYYQEMVASLPVPLVVLSSERNVVSANRSFRQTFQLRFEDLRRKSIDQILPSERLVERIRDVHTHGITQQPFSLEIDGRLLRIAIVPIRTWDDDMEVETLLMVEDLTGIAILPRPASQHPLATQPSTTQPPASGPTAAEPAVVPEPSAISESPAHAVPAPVSTPEPASEAFAAEDDSAAETAPEAATEQLEEQPELAEALEAAAPSVEEPTPTPELSERAKAPEPSAPEAKALDLTRFPIVLWTADPSTLNFTSVAGAIPEILGYPAAHWLETPRFFTERIHPEDRAAIAAFYQSAFEHGGDASAEFRAVTASGDAVWCRETIRVSAPGEDVRTVTGVLSEIGGRKEGESRRLIAGRNAALQGLAGRLAHDLNNPLMIVTGYGEEMLLNISDQDPRRDDVAQILAATERISALTHQLLEFTRTPAATAEPVEVTAVIARNEESLAHAAGDNVVLEPAAGHPLWAYTDEAQLRDILIALVSAAREDAAERSRVIIACDQARIDEQLGGDTLAPGVYTRISIRDNGKGLDAEKRAAIFESLLSKDPEKTAGTALARAYAVVRGWGGDIAFSSEPFRGSTFTIYLRSFIPEPPPVPVAPVEAAPVEAPGEPQADGEPGDRASQETSETSQEAIPAPAPEPAPEPLREMILVVDDEAGIRALVAKILRRERYQVLEAGSAEDALRIASTRGAEIDLLLTDVVLPGAHGRQLAEQMRGNNPDLKVLYVSGYTGDDAVQTGDFPPGSKFLQKPFTLSALVRKVHEAIEG